MFSQEILSLLAEKERVELQFNSYKELKQALPKLQSITLKCSEDARLYIDAPNVTHLERSPGAPSTVMNISYLPSLQQCDLDMLYALDEIAPPDMRAELDVMLLHRDTSIHCHYHNQMEIDAAKKHYDTQVMRAYLICYHELGRQGMLLPVHASRAKSARSSSR